MEYYNNDYLMHYGVKGMKWGVRRYQNADGSLTPAGKKKYGDDPVGRAKLNVKSAKKEYSKSFNKAYNYSTTPRFTKKGKAERDRRWEDAYDKLDKLDKAKSEYKEAKNTPEAKAARQAKTKKALKVGAAVAGTALAAYGAYKVHEFVREKNRDIRVNEGKAKCDRMLKKLDRMRINDLVTGSGANERWVNRPGYKTPLQYNNNGRSVTIPREYRNTNSTLSRSQYRNIENKVIEKTINEAFDKAKNDSFATAAKNVANHYLEEAKRKRR